MMVEFVFQHRYTYLDNPFGKYEIPLTQGVQIRVVLGGLVAGTLRACIETPLEYAKVNIRLQFKAQVLKKMNY
jgi:hypothetical protein